jgi:hypothetical protein
MESVLDQEATEEYVISYTDRCTESTDLQTTDNYRRMLTLGSQYGPAGSSLSIESIENGPRDADGKAMGSWISSVIHDSGLQGQIDRYRERIEQSVRIGRPTQP